MTEVCCIFAVVEKLDFLGGFSDTVRGNSRKDYEALFVIM